MGFEWMDGEEMDGWGGGWEDGWGAGGCDMTSGMRDLTF